MSAAEFNEEVEYEKFRLRARRKAAEELDGDRAGELVLTPASEVKSRPVPWVWHHRLPRGTFSLGAGKGGAGKSLHAVWLTSMITRGRLDGCWRRKPKTVLWVTLEASREYEVNPRLEAAQADMTRVHYVTVEVDDDPANDHIRIFDPAHVEKLRKEIDRHDVGMIVLDPALDVFDGKVNADKQQQVRQAIGRLSLFAEDMSILIYGLAHFNKMNSVDDALARITGSAAWSQRVRAALVFAYNDEDDCFVMSQGKNNWGPLQQPNLAFRAKPVEIAGNIPTVVVEWTDDDYEHPVTDILGGRHKRDAETKQERACKLISELLADGPQLRGVIVGKLEAESIGARTTDKAARELGVISVTPEKSQLNEGSKRPRGNLGVLWQLPAVEY